MLMFCQPKTKVLFFFYKYNFIQIFLLRLWGGVSRHTHINSKTQNKDKNFSPLVKQNFASLK